MEDRNASPASPQPEPPPRSGAPPVIAPDGFIPQCPRCRYDLTGLPDGPCPECGTRFGHASLIVAELRRRQQSPPTHMLLILGLVIGCAPCLWVPEAALQVFVLILMWILIGAWMNIHRQALANESAVKTLWLIIPVLRTGAVFLALPVAPVTTLVTLGAVAGFITYAYIRQPVPTVRSLGIVLSAPMLIIGGGLVFHGLTGMAAGHYWSPWDYPFWGHINYPWRPRANALSYPQLLSIGLAFIAIALIPGILALALLRRLRRRPAPASPCD